MTGVYIPSKSRFFLEGNLPSFTPSDTTTYLLGQPNSAGLYWACPKAGRILAVSQHVGYIAGSGEDVSVYVTVYDPSTGSTDTLLGTIKLDATPIDNLWDNLDIPVAAGLYVSLKWVCPAWVTNPTKVIPYYALVFELD